MSQCSGEEYHNDYMIMVKKYNEYSDLKKISQGLQSSDAYKCDGKSFSDAGSKPERIVNGELRCSCENELVSECSVRENSELNSCDEEPQMLNAIENCCETNLLEAMLEKSKTEICRLLADVSNQNNLIQKYKKHCQAYADKYEEQKQISDAKDTEISAMKNDLAGLVDEMKRVMDENASLKCKYEKMSNELCLKTVEHNEFVEKFQKLSYNIKDKEHCLQNEMAEKKGLTKEFCEKNQIIEDFIKCNEKLVCNIHILEKKLKEADALKNYCDCKCVDLIKKNSELVCNLIIQEAVNREKSRTIQCLGEKVQTLITENEGFDVQIKLYEENIATLYEDKCIVERQLNTEIDRLNCTIKTLNGELAIEKTELIRTKDHLKRKEEENECLNKDVESLKCCVQNYVKQIQSCKDQIITLAKTKLINEIELMSLKDSVCLLKNHVHQATRDNEKQKEHILLLSRNTNILENKLENVERENCELPDRSCKFEGENCKLLPQIKELNDFLHCTKIMENECRAKLIARKEKVSVVNEKLCVHDAEIKCIKQELEKDRENLCCVKKQ